MGDYEIRDPVHKTIIIDELERSVVDSPWVQRLRQVRQLGFVNLVYPGAVHDRFQHSLGVMHLAGTFFQRLCDDGPSLLHGIDPGDRQYCRRVLRLAGLLHDVGHAPFSHAAEHWLPDLCAVALPADWYRAGRPPAPRPATHEDISLKVVERLLRDGVLDEPLARDVASLLDQAVAQSPQFCQPLAGIARALISGEVDADRCDYLLRDSHYTGVSYGVYDLPRLTACLKALPGPDGPELGLDVHGVYALEDLLMARYHMFLQVYFHKTPPAFAYYLERAVEDGEIELLLDGDLDRLIDLRDDTVIGRLHQAAGRGGFLSRRIIAREPARLVLRERVGAEQQENFLAQELVEALTRAGCHVFTRRSRQRFTGLAGAGSVADGSRLLCERRILGRAIVESVTAHSDLLAAFNRPIDLRYTYVLREDGERARGVMDTWPVW